MVNTYSNIRVHRLEESIDEPNDAVQETSKAKPQWHEFWILCLYNLSLLSWSHKEQSSCENDLSRMTTYESWHKEMALTMTVKGEPYIIIPQTTQIIPTNMDREACEWKQRSVKTATIARSASSPRSERAMIIWWSSKQTSFGLSTIDENTTWKDTLFYGSSLCCAPLSSLTMW